MSPNNTATESSTGPASSDNQARDAEVSTQSNRSSSRSTNSSPSNSASGTSSFDSSQTTQCSPASAHDNSSEVNDQEFYQAIFGLDAIRPPPSRIGSPASSEGSVVPNTSSWSSKDSPPSPGEGPSTRQQSASTTSSFPRESSSDRNERYRDVPIFPELQTLFNIYGREVYFQLCDELLSFSRPHTLTPKSIKGKEIRQPIEDFEDILLKYGWEEFWRYYGSVKDVNPTSTSLDLALVGNASGNDGLGSDTEPTQSADAPAEDEEEKKVECCGDNLCTGQCELCSFQRH